METPLLAAGDLAVDSQPRDCFPRRGVDDSVVRVDGSFDCDGGAMMTARYLGKSGGNCQLVIGDPNPR